MATYTILSDTFSIEQRSSTTYDASEIFIYPIQLVLRTFEAEEALHTNLEDELHQVAVRYRMTPIDLFYSSYSNAACQPLSTYKGGATCSEVDLKVWSPVASIWSLIFADIYHDTR